MEMLAEVKWEVILCSSWIKCVREGKTERTQTVV